MSGGECPTTVSIVARPRPAARDRRSAAASNSRRKHGGSGRVAAARSVAHLIGRATAAPAEPSVPGNDTRIGSIAAAVEHTHTHTTFVRDDPGGPVPQEAFTHSHPTVLCQLPPSTTTHSILRVQFTYLAVLFHNLSSGLLFPLGLRLST